MPGESGFFDAISIHTPTKGVTVYPLSNFVVHVYFNPHSHEGSDGTSFIPAFFAPNFNPHSHEGSDKDRHVRALYTFDFNPHSHEGSDR